MSYDIGSHIDLSSINKKVTRIEKKTTGQKLYDVGTAFIFQLTPEGFKAALKIPVVCY